MVLVFALLGGTLWWLRRHDRSSLISARRTEKPVAVLAQTRVGKSASVAVVRIGAEAYAVGVTDQSVALLIPQPVTLPELDDGDGPDASASGSVTRAASRTASRPQPGPPTVGEFLRRITGRAGRVQYLDVELPAPRPAASRPTPRLADPAGTATDGSGRVSPAGKPEPVSRR